MLRLRCAPFMLQRNHGFWTAAQFPLADRRQLSLSSSWNDCSQHSILSRQRCIILVRLQGTWNDKEFFLKLSIHWQWNTGVSCGGCRCGDFVNSRVTQHNSWGISNDAVIYNQKILQNISHGFVNFLLSCLLTTSSIGINVISDVKRGKWLLASNPEV